MLASIRSQHFNPTHELMADPKDWPTNSQPLDVSDSDGGEPDEATYYFTGLSDTNEDSGKVAVYNESTGVYAISDVAKPT